MCDVTTQAFVIAYSYWTLLHVPLSRGTPIFFMWTDTRGAFHSFPFMAVFISNAAFIFPSFSRPSPPPPHLPTHLNSFLLLLSSLCSYWSWTLKKDLEPTSPPTHIHTHLRQSPRTHRARLPFKSSFEPQECINMNTCLIILYSKRTIQSLLPATQKWNMLNWCFTYSRA